MDQKQPRAFSSYEELENSGLRSVIVLVRDANGSMSIKESWGQGDDHFNRLYDEFIGWSTLCVDKEDEFVQAAFDAYFRAAEIRVWYRPDENPPYTEFLIED